MNKNLINKENSDVVIVCSQVGKTVSSPEGDIHILNQIDLKVHAGESVAIIGQSGSGKTTLLGLLAGLDSLTTGSIQLFHQELSQMDEEQRTHLRSTSIGFVFQAFHLLSGFTALENVLLPLEITGCDDAQQRAAAMLDRVGMSHRLHHYPATLSGGEQQRVAIARAFVTEPSILLADEPTGNLDDETGARIIKLLFDVNREHHTTMVLVTHDHALSRGCDLRFELRHGVLNRC